MPGDEVTQRELQKALDYVEGKNEKISKSRKKTAEEIKEKGLAKEAVLAEMLGQLPKEKTDEKEIESLFGASALETIKTIKRIDEVLEKNYEKIPAETLNSILLSLSNDFEPIIMKVAEIANELEEGADKKKAKMAEDIYAPIATKLGLNDYVWRLADYAFRTNNPEGWKKIKNLINKPRKEREELVEEARKEIEELLKGKLEAEVTGRPKNFKAIYEKLKKVPFQKMHDIYGVRIICQREKECYEALGYIHAKYEIIPEAFDDYISKPKPNGYKSIHTAVKRGEDIIEVQIRTWEHHLRSLGENYWAYKKIRKDKEFEKELSWERQLIEWQKSLGKEGLGKKNTGKKIFAFTPKNQAIPLPIGATAIDFAFAVHTDIGKRMEKAKVNGKYVPIETRLNNLDRVEIITAEKPQLKKTWLNFAATDKAKTKIKTHFGMKLGQKKKATAQIAGNIKKIKMAECCHPLPGEDVIGVKTTKRKIIIHKKDCLNIQKISKSKLVEIGFERDKGKTILKVTAIDRPGLLGEMLAEIKHSASLVNTNFKIKKSGYAEAMFELEIGSAQKLENLIEKLEKIPSVQGVERI